MPKTEIHEKFIVAAGFRTRYLEAGTRDNPTVVLLHDGAFGTTAELCWGGMIDLLGRDFHVLAPELLGWGGTDKAIFLDRSPYAGRIPHVAALLEALDLVAPRFVGTSFGGSLLLRAAVEDGNPWRIERAVSISGTGGPYRLPLGLEALAEYTPSLEAARKLTTLLVASPEGLDEHIRQRHENSLIPGHWEALSAPRLRNPSADRPAREDPYLARLEELTIPTLLVAGQRDPLLEPGWARKMAALSPAIEFVELDEAGHEPNIDAVAALHAATIGFLKKGPEL